MVNSYKLLTSYIPTFGKLWDEPTVKKSPQSDFWPLTSTFYDPMPSHKADGRVLSNDIYL